MTESISRARQHIQKIRREKFSLDAAGNSTIKNPLSGDLQNAVENLSVGLYSKETHFVFELIQNAEDNHYPSSVKPKLAFSLLEDAPTETPEAKGALLITNNERGFLKSDVENICSVGATDKEKSKGYVGEKGIGFKSVFVVSSQPHIFSNGYQFRFQEQPDQAADLGYIVPYWVDRVPPEVQEGNTNIILPIKPGKYQDVVNELKDVSPNTILFLSKLKGLTVRLENERALILKREDKARPLITIEINSPDKDSHQERYWLESKDFNVPTDISEEKRFGVEKRALSVAFPLSNPKIPLSNIFAYLPTRELSFLPFIVNADFILSTSRENIQYQRSWNQWLRDCIPDVFVKGFLNLIQDKNYVLDAYGFIPIPVEGQDEFYQPVIENIQNQLRTLPIINTHITGKLISPKRARWAPDDFQDLLTSSSLPLQLQETPLIHHAIYKNHLHQVQAVGVKKLSQDETLQCFKDSMWLQDQSTNWFPKLYSYLSQKKWVTKESLHEIQLLYCADKMLRNGEGNRVYYTDRPISKTHQPPGLPSSIFEAHFLHPTILELIEENTELISWMEDNLGIREFTLENYCRDLAKELGHISHDVEPSKIIRATQFIQSHFHSFNTDVIEVIKNALPFVLDDGEVVNPDDREKTRVITPENLDPDLGWQRVFVTPEDRSHLSVLTSEYMEGCTSDEELSAWHKFFIAMGVTDVPLPKRREWYFPSHTNTPENLPQEISGYAKDIFGELQERSTRKQSICDWIPPSWLRELHNAPPEPEIDPRTFRAFFTWFNRLAKLAGREEPAFFKGEYRYFYHSQKTRKFESDFLYCVLNTPWVPTTDGLKKSGESFLDKQQLQELFKDKIPYLTSDPHKKVVEWLDFRKTATVSELIAYLKQLSSDCLQSVDRKVIHKIYQFLAARWQENLLKEFEDHPLIFLPGSDPQWVRSYKAVWPDLSPTFQDEFIYLDQYYNQNFKDFFVNKVGINAELDNKLYAQKWLDLVNNDAYTRQDIENALKYIYPQLLMVARQKEHPPWWKKFKDECRVWTRDGTFQSPRKTYVPDDGKLMGLFSKKGIKFIWYPEEEAYKMYRPLFDSLGIRSLKRNVQTKLPNTSELSNLVPSETPFLTPCAKKAILYHLWNNSNEQYDQAKESGTLEALIRTKEKTVENISLVYQLFFTSTTDPDCRAYWDHNGRSLYLSSQYTRGEIKIGLPSSITRTLNGNDLGGTLDHFIGRVLRIEKGELAALLQTYNWNMPEEETVWMEQIIGEVDKEIEEPFAEATRGAGRPHMVTPPKEKNGGPATTRRQHQKTASSNRTSHAEHPQKSRNLSRKGRGVPSNRMITYVEPEGRQNKQRTVSKHTVEEKRAIEKKAINFALEYEKEHDRDPEELPKTHPGHDIKSRDSQLGKEGTGVRYIEVKGLKDRWQGWGIGLTPSEMKAARNLGDRYFLYVVEQALDLEKSKIHVIKDPANKISEYRFDHQWLVMSEEPKDSL